MKEIKIILAEDHPYLRSSLVRDINETSKTIDVIADAENGLMLIQLLRKMKPDIILLDLGMPFMSGWDVLKVVKKEFSTIKVIMFSNDYTEYLVAQAVLLGAVAYIDKATNHLTDICKVIEKVHNDGFYFNQEAAKFIIRSLEREKKIYYLIEKNLFSKREIEIIEKICSGKPIKQIAADLELAEATVKKHKENIFDKTGADRSVDLVLYAIRQGIFIVSKI